MAEESVLFTGWLNSGLSKLLVSVLVAAMTLILGFILGKLVEKISRRLLRELGIGGLLRKAGWLSPEESIGKTLAFVIYFLAVVSSLNRLGLAKTALYVLSGLIAVLLCIWLILSLTNFVPNLFAGLLRQRAVRVGDVIRVGSIQGRVVKVRLSEVAVETEEKDFYFIPNRLMKNYRMVRASRAG